MRLLRHARLLMLIAFTVAGLVACASVGYAGTTTSAPMNCNYDESAASAHAGAYADDALSDAAGVRSARNDLAAKGGVSALEEASETAFRASRGPINISRKHYPGAGGGYSKFEQGIEIDATVREALQSPGAIFRPNRNAAGDIIPGYRVYTDLGRTVGTRGETGLRTIVSPDGRVITSFPGRPWG